MRSGKNLKNIKYIMNLKDIKKLELTREKYEWMLNCNVQNLTKFKVYVHNERYFNTSKLSAEEQLDLINSLNSPIINRKPAYHVTLRSPFWSAWQKYGWEKGVPGYGVRDLIVDAVIRDQTSLVVKYKHDSHRISWKKLLPLITDHNYYFNVSSKTRLYVLPRSEFTKVQKRSKNEKNN